MTFFFLVVGLEAKRELDMGELRERRRIAMPVVAAVGGIVGADRDLPRLQRRRRRRRRLGRGDVDRHRVRARRARARRPGAPDAPARVPAHARGRRRPRGAAGDRDRLHRAHRLRSALGVAVGAVLRVRAALRAGRASGAGRRRRRSAPAIWVALHESGIDPRIAGLAVGLLTSAYPPARADLERVTDAGALVPRAADARARPLGPARRCASAISPNERLQYRAAPVDELRDRPAVRARQRRHHARRRAARATPLRSPITLGHRRRLRRRQAARDHDGACWLADRALGAALRLPVGWPRARRAAAPSRASASRSSLLIASLAFTGGAWRRPSSASSPPRSSRDRAGLADLPRDRRCCPARVRARQLAGTAEDILDLADDVDPERDHIRGPDGRARDARRVRRLRVPLLRPGRGGHPRAAPRRRRRPALRLAPPAAATTSTRTRSWRPRRPRRPARRARSGRCTTGCSTTRTRCDRATWSRHAEELGLDVGRFRERAAHARMGRAGQPRTSASADASGVTGTPTFFINGRRHHGAYDLETLTARVRTARSRALL